MSLRKLAAIPGRYGGATAVIVLCATIAVGLPSRLRAQSQAGSVAVAAFEAIDHNGKPFSSASLSGQPYAIFFGFTRCPDVCPTTLLEISTRLQELEADGNRLKMLFVTVDVEHDTPDQLRAYLSSFDSRIIGLTGSEQQIAAIAKTYNAFYYKLREDDGSYTMTHSAYVYLVDGNNRRAGELTFQDSESEQLAKLRRLLAPN
jgi:protein SCO1/2